MGNGHRLSDEFFHIPDGSGTPPLNNILKGGGARRADPASGSGSGGDEHMSPVARSRPETRRPRGRFGRSCAGSGQVRSAAACPRYAIIIIHHHHNTSTHTRLCSGRDWCTRERCRDFPGILSQNFAASSAFSQNFPSIFRQSQTTPTPSSLHTSRHSLEPGPTSTSKTKRAARLSLTSC